MRQGLPMRPEPGKPSRASFSIGKGLQACLEAGNQQDMGQEKTGVLQVARILY
jgi:hypothetical protein